MVYQPFWLFNAKSCFYMYIKNMIYTHTRAQEGVYIQYATEC